MFPVVWNTVDNNGQSPGKAFVFERLALLFAGFSRPVSSIFHVNLSGGLWRISLVFRFWSWRWCVQLARPHRAIEESRRLRKISRVARRCSVQKLRDEMR